MPESNTKTTVKVTVDIRPGSVSPARKAAYRRFWSKLISQVMDGLDNGENPKSK